MRSALNIPKCLSVLHWTSLVAYDRLLSQTAARMTISGGVVAQQRAVNAVLDINVLPSTKHFAAQTACLTCLVPIAVGVLMSGNVLHLMFLQKGHCICVAGSPGKPQIVLV